jgi:hypothetical protein
MSLYDRTGDLYQALLSVWNLLLLPKQVSLTFSGLIHFCKAWFEAGLVIQDVTHNFGPHT